MPEEKSTYGSLRILIVDQNVMRGSVLEDGLREAAVSRYNAFSKLRDELERAKAALDERKLVDRAKGILMKERGMSEEAAYALLRRAAMNENRRITEVAQSIVTVSKLLK